MEQYSLTPYMLSRICVFIRNEIEKEEAIIIPKIEEKHEIG